MTKVELERNKIQSLSKAIDEKFYEHELYNIMGTGVYRVYPWGKMGLPIYLILRDDKAVTFAIHNASGIGSNCFKAPGIKGTPGLTHYFEHCMHHNVTINGKKMNQQELFNYATTHNIVLNAGTNSVSITNHASFTPAEGYDMSFDGVFKSSLEVFRVKQKDITKEAIDLVTAIAYKHDLKQATLDKEKAIVCSEINMYHNDDNFWLEILTDSTSTYYDELGTTESVQGITMEDMEAFDNIFKSGKSLRGVSLSLNYFDYSNDYIINTIDYIVESMESVLPLEVLKCVREHKEFNHKYTIKTPTNQKRKAVKIKPNSMTSQPMLVIEIPRDMQPGDKPTINQSTLESFTQMLLYAGLSRPINDFREKYGRTYSVIPLRRFSRTGDHQIGDRTGWVTFYNNHDGNGANIDKATAEQMIGEIEEVMNNLTVSKEEFNSWKKDAMVQRVRLCQRTVPLTHLIVGMETGQLDIERMDKNTTAGFKFIAYDKFCKYLEFIKENWIATLYANVEK